MGPVTPEMREQKIRRRNAEKKVGYVGNRRVAVPVKEDTTSRVHDSQGHVVEVKVRAGCCMPDGDSVI